MKGEILFYPYSCSYIKRQVDPPKTLDNRKRVGIYLYCSNYTKCKFCIIEGIEKSCKTAFWCFGGCCLDWCMDFGKKSYRIYINNIYYRNKKAIPWDLTEVLLLIFFEKLFQQFYLFACKAISVFVIFVFSAAKLQGFKHRQQFDFV